jgi:hypothetical protein
MRGEVALGMTNAALAFLSPDERIDARIQVKSWMFDLHRQVLLVHLIDSGVVRERRLAVSAGSISSMKSNYCRSPSGETSDSVEA